MFGKQQALTCYLSLRLKARSFKDVQQWTHLLHQCLEGRQEHVQTEKLFNFVRVVICLMPEAKWPLYVFR